MQRTWHETCCRDVGVTVNYGRPASLLRRHPTCSLSSSLFRVRLNVCTYGGGFKGRAKWYSMRECECEGWGAQRKGAGDGGRGGWRKGDSGSRCHEDSGIVGDPFCCLVFLFPRIIPPPPPSTKEKRELTFSTGVGKPGKWQNTPPPPVFECVRVCLYYQANSPGIL